MAVLLLSCLAGSHAEDWPQWRGPRRDGTWNETNIIERFPESGPKITWRVPVGPGFSSPVIAKERVYLTDAELVRPKANEHVYCFDAVTGSALWKHRYPVEYEDWAFDPKSPGGPRSTPILHDGKLYTLGATGNLICFDAMQGDVLWQKRLKVEYDAANASFTPSLLIEGDLLIVIVGAEPGPCVVAFDLNSGREMWRALDEPSVYSSPIVIRAAGKNQLIVVTLRSVTALDPQNGQAFWRVPLRSTRDMSVPTPAYSKGYLWINGLMLKLVMDQPGAEVLWPQEQAPPRRTLSNTSSGQFIAKNLYTSNLAGQLICVQPADGTILWETDKATTTRNGASIHITPRADTAFLFNDQGELILARLGPDGYKEINRAALLRGTYAYAGKQFAWTAPGFSNGHVFARNDQELVCADLRAGSRP